MDRRRSCVSNFWNPFLKISLFSSKLKELEKGAQQNGVMDARIISSEELLRKEPNLSKEAKAGLLEKLDPDELMELNYFSVS